MRQIQSYQGRLWTKNRVREDRLGRFWVTLRISVSGETICDSAYQITDFKHSRIY